MDRQIRLAERNKGAGSIGSQLSRGELKCCVSSFRGGMREGGWH